MARVRIVNISRGLGLASLLVFMPNCTKPASGPEPKSHPEKRILVIGSLHEPDTLDPLFTSVSATREPLGLLLRDLTRYGADWSVHADLAKELPRAQTSSSGQTRFEWTLKPGLRWSDGRSLTAADVIFGHSVEADPSRKAPGQSFAAKAHLSAGPSKLEFIANWGGASLQALAPRNHAILPKHVYPSTSTSAFRKPSVASGPYQIKNWAPGEYLATMRNPHWAGQKPYFDEIVFRFIRSEESFEAQLRSGGIDAIGESGGLSIERAVGIGKRLQKSHVVSYTDSGVWLHLDTRMDHPATSKKEVRKAISLSLDRKVIAQLAYAGKATAAWTCFPPRHLGVRGRGPTKDAMDLVGAQKLIAAAKLSPSERRLTLQFASGSQSAERTATYIQSQLKKIGLRLELRATPFRVMFADMRAKKQAALVLYAWRSSPSWDGRSIFHSSGGQNFTGLKDETLDSLYDALEKGEPHSAGNTLSLIERRYRNLLPVIPLLFRQSVSVRPRNLKGWAPTGTQTPVTWNAETWSF